MKKYYIFLACLMIVLVGCSNNESTTSDESEVRIPALRAGLEDATFNWDVLTTDPHTESLHELRNVTEETTGDEKSFTANVGENIELSLTSNTIREKLTAVSLQMPLQTTSADYSEFLTAVELLFQSTQPQIGDEGRTTILQNELGIVQNATFDSINNSHDTKSALYNIKAMNGNLVFEIIAK